MKKNNNQIKAGAILSYIIVGINILIGFIYTPILIRMLGQAEYGLYSLVASFMSYLSILDFGLGNAIVVYTAKAIAKKDETEEHKLNGVLFIVYCIIGLLTLLIGIFLYFNVQTMFSKTMTVYEHIEAKKLIIIFTLNIALSFPLSVFSNIVVAYEKFIFSKVAKIIQIVSAPIITLPILMLYPKAWPVLIITAITNILFLIINAFYAKKKIKIRISFKNLDFGILKEIFNYSIYVFLNVVVDKVNWSVDQVILGATSGTMAVAVYSVGAKINHLFNTMSTALSGVTLPKIAKMEEDKKPIKEFDDIFVKTGRIQFLILALVLSGFVIFGKSFMNFWAGKGYIDSYYVAIILMFGGFIPLIENIGIGILQVKNKHKFRTIVIVFIAVFNVLISIYMAKLWGGIGAALGTLIALVLGQGIILNIYYHKVIGLNILRFFKEILKMSFPILIIAIPSYYLFNYMVPRNFIYLVLGILIYILIYLLTIWCFSINRYEKDQVKNILSKFKKKKIQKEN